MCGMIREEHRQQGHHLLAHQAHRGKPTAIAIDVIIVGGGGGGGSGITIGGVDVDGYPQLGEAFEHLVAHGSCEQQDLLLDAHQLVGA